MLAFKSKTELILYEYFPYKDLVQLIFGFYWDHEFDNRQVFEYAYYEGISNNINRFPICYKYIHNICYDGYYSIMKLIIDKYPLDKLSLDIGLNASCAGNHLSLVNYLIDLGASSLDIELEMTIINKNTNKELHDLLIKKGAKINNRFIYLC